MLNAFGHHTFKLGQGKLSASKCLEGSVETERNNSIAPPATLGSSDVVAQDLLIRFSLGYLRLDMNCFVQDLSS